MIRSKVHHAFLEAQLSLTESLLQVTSGSSGNVSFSSIPLLFAAPGASASDIYFMCREICVLKSLGDWHGLEELCVKLNKKLW